MEKKNLHALFARAMTDQQFRQDLIENPTTTPRRFGYELTTQEIAMLKKLSAEGEEAFSRGLDERLSKTGFLLTPAEFLREQGQEVGLVPLDTEKEELSGEELDSREVTVAMKEEPPLPAEEDEELSGEELDVMEGPLPAVQEAASGSKEESGLSGEELDTLEGPLASTDGGAGGPP